jgi:uncharacterized membrane protein
MAAYLYESRDSGIMVTLENINNHEKRFYQHLNVSIDMYICVYTCILTYTCVCVCYTYMYVYIHEFVSMYNENTERLQSIYTYMHVYISIYMTLIFCYIYMYKQ